jgi:flagellar basal-body rod protein FlgG
MRGIEKLARDMEARVARQELVANNLANATTPGFKAQRLFERILRNSVETGGTAKTLGTYTSFMQGPIEHTHRKLDLAIQGDGFFVVDTPSGEMYTRNGSFTLDQYGTITTQAGHPVQGIGGPVAVSGRDITITPEGRILVDNAEMGTLRVVSFSDPQMLVREGNLYRSTQGEGIQADMNRTTVVQGALERSNVSPIEEMIEMIAVHRGFEADQRAITVADQSSRRLIERLGKFG